MNGQEESSLQTESQIAWKCAFLIFISIGILVLGKFKNQASTNRPAS